MPRTPLLSSTPSSCPLAVALVLLALGACKGGAMNLGDSGDSSDSGEAPVSDQAPTVSDLDAYCYPHDSDEGEELYFWVVNGYASDPQGDATLETNGLLEIYRGGALVVEFSLVVGRSGEVVTSFSSDQLGVPCNDSAPDYLFRAIVYDEEGHEGWSEVAGRQD